MPYADAYPDEERRELPPVDPAAALRSALRMLGLRRPAKAALIARELGLQTSEECDLLRQCLRQEGWQYAKGGYWRPPAKERAA